LKVKKYYLWGDKSTPDKTRKFIESNPLPNHCFQGSGHWPMIDQPTRFYQFVSELIAL